MVQAGHDRGAPGGAGGSGGAGGLGAGGAGGMSAGIYLYDSYAASWVDMSYDIGGAGNGGSGASLISVPGLPVFGAVDGPEGQRHEFLFAHTPPEWSWRATVRLWVSSASPPRG